MDKIKCVIVEDEQHTARLMEDYLSKMSQLELLGVFVSPIELLNFPQLESVQIIYLDIQTPEMTGLEFLKSIPVTAEVIITTAYPEYALDGYELNVIDYLLKPVKLSRFITATTKAVAQIKLKQLGESKPEEEYLFIKVDKQQIKVYTKDIVYLKADWNYVHIFTTTDKFMVHSTFKHYTEILTKLDFAIIHKSYLINLAFFESILGNQVQVNGITLQVSRTYKDELIRRVKKE